MPYSKLKNLMLLILLLVNLLLLALVIPLRMERSEQRRQIDRRLEELFASYDLSLDSSILPDSQTLYPLELEPDDAAAQAAAAALLGGGLPAQNELSRLGGSYCSDLGSCRIARSGSFAAQFQNTERADNLEAAVRALLSGMGVDAASVAPPVRKSAGVYDVTAVQAVNAMPVFSAALSFTYYNSVLRTVEGTVYLSSAPAVRADGDACISCADALAAFLASRDTLGWVGSTITAVEQGYVRAETASAAVVRLTPGWLISTDTGRFWVNGLTREVSAFQM